MGRFIAQVLISLLALNQTLCAALPYQHPHEPPTARLQNVPLEATIDKYNTSSQDHPTSLTKRTPPPVNMVNLGGQWGSTYVDATPEPANSGWTRQDIRGLAKAGYEQVVAVTRQPNMIVAALWVPGQGVYLGSIPQDGGQIAFTQEAPTNAPRLWDAVRGRKYTADAAGSESMFHAEDMAMFWFEDRQQPQRILDSYPQFSFIAVYGKKPNNAKASIQDPCSGPARKINPDCLQVLRQLDVATNK